MRCELEWDPDSLTSSETLDKLAYSLKLLCILLHIMWIPIHII